VALEAARTTLQKKGSPSTEEGRDAQRSMESRQRTAEKELAELLDQLLAGVRVFQAGGQEAVDGNDLADRINRAAKSSAIRLYSQFDAADHDLWSKVLDEARKGNLEALKAVGHTQEADKHPVCQKLLAYIGPGKKGAEIRDNFEAPPFGWPRDAIDGALYALLAAGHLKATDASSKPWTPRAWTAPSSPRPASSARASTSRRRSSSRFARCSARWVCPCQPKEELTKVPIPAGQIARTSLQGRRTGARTRGPEAGLHRGHRGPDRQRSAAGAVHPPRRTGAGLSKTGPRPPTTLPSACLHGSKLNDLLRHAKALGPYAALKAEVDAIEAQRSLLADPDPVRPLLDKAVELLAPGSERQAGRVPAGVRTTASAPPRRRRLEQAQPCAT
jgi:hypothetical protein